MDLEHTSLAHADAYLSHHGILGQKWGVRRYQNEDGSLTTLGRERYDQYKSKYDKATYNKQQAEVNAHNARDSKEFYERALRDAYERAGSDINEILKLNVDELSNKREEHRSREDYYNEIIEKCNTDIKDAKWVMEGILSGYFDDSGYALKEDR